MNIGVMVPFRNPPRRVRPPRRRRAGGVAILGVAVCVAAAALPGSTARAAAGAGYCVVDTVMTTAEGITMDPASEGTLTTAGTVVCQGTPAGITATGPGIYTSHGTFRGGCANLSGEVTFRMDLPTADGMRSVGDTATYRAVYFASDTASGTFHIAGMDGDCVTRPLHEVRLLAQFFFPN